MRPPCPSSLPAPEVVPEREVVLANRRRKREEAKAHKRAKTAAQPPPIPPQPVRDAGQEEARQARMAHKKRQAQRKVERLRREVDGIVQMANIEQQTHSLRIPLPPPLTPIEWGQIPTSLLPVFDNNTPQERGLRKRQQCESFLRVLEPLVSRLRQTITDRRLRIADFGCGTGNSSLPLAYALRETCDFVLFDRYETPVQIAQTRASEAKLSNVTCTTKRIEHVTKDAFDLCLAFHVCGGASDEVIQKALLDKSAFLICSCCIGKLKHLNREGLNWPRSKWLEQKNISSDQYLNLLAKVADHSANGFAQAKLLIELDRLAHASELGYRTFHTNVMPLSATPKNDIIVAVPPSWKQLDHCLLWPAVAPPKIGTSTSS